VLARDEVVRLGQSEGIAMSERVQFFGIAVFCGLLSLCLIALGCGREAELEKMAESLKSNSPTLHGDGFPADYDFWVDEKMTRKTTVKKKLTELGASLQDGKVVDAAGRELYFYKVTHRYHHPLDPRPPRPTEKEEIKELEKTYHVIRMYIGPPTE
jgi:hypothetical protein